jgi:hypothetical protein
MKERKTKSCNAERAGAGRSKETEFKKAPEDERGSVSKESETLYKRLGECVQESRKCVQERGGVCAVEMGNCVQEREGKYLQKSRWECIRNWKNVQE